jgi:hypothetical protein
VIEPTAPLIYIYILRVSRALLFAHRCARGVHAQLYGGRARAHRHRSTTLHPVTVRARPSVYEGWKAGRLCAGANAGQGRGDRGTNASPTKPTRRSRRTSWTCRRKTTATCAAAARSPHLTPPPCTASSARTAVHTHTAVRRVRTPNCKSGHTSVRP